MSVTTERLILDFADTGIAAHEAGVLPDALSELAIRLELAGAGGLLAELCRLDWTDGPAKRDPKPVPTPKPPPPPPPPNPKGGQS